MLYTLLAYLVIGIALAELSARHNRDRSLAAQTYLWVVLTWVAMAPKTCIGFLLLVVAILVLT